MIDFLQKLQQNNIRVKLVDGKLKLLTAAESIDPVFMEEIKQKKDLLIRFFQQQEIGNDFGKQIPRLDPAEKYALSHSQKRLWILSLFEDSRAAYNIPFSLIIHAEVNLAILEQAVNSVVGKYEILRTAFREDQQGDVWQYILTEAELNFKINYHDLSSASEKDMLAAEIATAGDRTAFDLRNPPLFKIDLIKLDNERYFFSFTTHHIISDGWSMGILMNDLFSAYQELLEGNLPQLIVPRIQYKEYAAWHNGLLESGKMNVHRNFWMELFKDEIAPISIPLEKPRPSAKRFNGGEIRTLFSKETTEGLNDYCQKNGGTLYIGLLSVIYALLHKYSGQTEIVFGTPVAGREHADLADQMGLFINTIPVKIKCEEDDDFQTVFRKVKDTSLSCFEHQMYPFDQLIEDLKLKRDLSRNALFDIMLVLQNVDQKSIKTDLMISEYYVSKTTSQVDINFNFNETADGLVLLLIYDSDIYERAFIEQMLSHLNNLFEGLNQYSEVPLKKLSLLNTKERHAILEGFNDTKYPWSQTDTMVSIFERQVKRTPQNTAVIDTSGSIDYEELNNISNQLGHFLLENEKKNCPYICIHTGRHRYMVQAAYSILKSGSAYLPVEPYIPQARKEVLLGKLGVETILTDAENLDSVLELSVNLPALKNIVCLDADVLPSKKYAVRVFGKSDYEKCASSNPDLKIDPDDLAYVIFTSGSTGVPKGVVVQHRPVINILEWVNRTFNITERDKLLFVTSLSFDLSVYDIFGMLSTGGSIRIVSSDDIRNPELLTQLVYDEEITFWDSAPAALQQLIPYFKEKKKENRKGSLRLVFMSGDWLPLRISDDLKNCFEGIDVISLGGATEATIWSNWFRIGTIDPNWISIPYGKPIQNAKYYVLDEYLSPCPPGIPGDLYIGGEVLALRYEGDEALTNRKFIPSPFDKNGRIYLTGDRARYFRDGNIEFLGRLDDQVKIRGYRIELGEIEHILHQYRGVTQSVLKVLKSSSGQNELAAYVISETPLNSKELRSYLQLHLPEYMVPAYFVQINEIPLTPNGKVNKQALPDPGEAEMASGVAYIAPSGNTEKIISELWQELLKKEKISVIDDFFESGGHSLLATSLLSRMRKIFAAELNLRDIFRNTTIRSQAALADSVQRTKYSGIIPAVTQENYSLSSSQRRLWVLSQFADGNIAYNMPGVYIFEGKLEIQSLEKAFRALISRHEILRTVFKENENHEIRQYIIASEEVDFRIPVKDFRKIKNEQTALKSEIQSEIFAPFDLEQGPLLRSVLYQTEENKWVFSYVMHHIISDGWSMGVMIQELLQLYHSFRNSEESPLEPLKIHYKDYASWQQSQLDGKGFQSDKKYWLEKFSGNIPVLELATDKIRPSVKTYNGAALYSIVNKELTSGLRELAQSENSTLFMSLLSVVNVLLYRYSGQEDIVIGTPVAGRSHVDLEDQIGFYINTLALRTEFSGAESFRSLLQRVRELTLEAYNHQDYPFDELVDELKLERDMSRSPLFDVMIVLQSLMSKKYVVKDDGSLKASAYTDAVSVISKFDLLFTFVEGEDDLQLKIEYNTDLYTRETIERFEKHLFQLLRAILRESSQAISQLDYLEEEEKQQLLVEFNTSYVESHSGKTLIDLFEEQVKKHPENAAVVFEGKILSYKKLDEHVTAFANYLNDEYNICPDDLIAIKLERNEWMIISILAVLKSGAAYVPVDTEYPAERIDFIIKDSASKVVVDEAELEKFRKNDKKYSGRNTSTAATPANLAYVIYTSGTTGNPKGVMIEHHSIVNYITSQCKAYGITSSERILQLSGFSFDASVEQIFVALLSGAALYVLPKALMLEEGRLENFIETNFVTHVHTVPAILKMLAVKKYPSLKRIISAGDVCLPELAREWNLYHDFYNKYGPTEITISSAMFLCKELKERQVVVPIGRPLANSKTYILDAEGQLVPAGVLGEIYVAGTGVARGYLNRPELDMQKFLSDNFSGKGRMYRTGDAGRWLANGMIECYGRVDNQVKINGYRIEPGEIENVLQQYPMVESVLVLAKKNKENEVDLTAYLVSKEKINVSELRSFMSGKLPSYMIPAYYVVIDKFPLTPNGKIDRKKLKDTENYGMISKPEYSAPQTETEKRLVEIWSVVLGIEKDKISVVDNFFERGGHSLKATRLLSRIHKEMGVKLNLKDLFSKVQLAEQAQLIDAAGKMKYEDIIPAVTQENYSLSSSQRRLWVLSQFADGNIAYNMPGVYIFEGKLEIQSLEKAFRALISRHEILRTVFKENENHEIRQYIIASEEVDFRIPVKDFRKIKNEQTALKSEIQSEIFAPFDLEQGPLLRSVLYQTEENKWVFSYVMHHIISDGWSMGVMIQELLQLYHSFRNSEESPLEPLKIHYKDYASWQQSQLDGKGFQSDKKYWLEKFSGNIPVLELATDKIRPSVKTYNGAALYSLVNKELTSGLRELAQSENSTLFMSLLSVVNVLLYRYSGQEDIVIGTPVAGRSHVDLEDQIGFYINTLALRTEFSGAESFRSLLQRVRELTLEAYNHQDYPFDELVDELKLERDMSRSPLFDVMLVLNNAKDVKQEQLGELAVSVYSDAEQVISKFDLTFDFTEAGEELALMIEYNTDMYTAERMERLSAHLFQLIEGLIKQPFIPLNQVDYLSNDEKQKLIESSISKLMAYPDKTLIGLFEEQVKKYPENAAVVFEGKTLSYKELDEYATAFANYLNDEYNICPDDLIAIKLERSEWMIISILAVLKSGAAYVPVDPAYPAERIDFIIKDSASKVVVDEAELEKFRKNDKKYSGRNTSTAATPANLAYVIYTSGTTGNPKGVLISNKSIVNRLTVETQLLNVDTATRTCLLTNYTFDVSMLEIFMPLINGGCVVVPIAAIVYSVKDLAEFLTAQGITVLQGTPGFIGSFVAALDEEAVLPQLKQLCIGGESLNGTLVKMLKKKLPNTKINNHYGPTECTVDAIVSEDIHDFSSNIIGYPIANVSVYILDELNVLVPFGVKGEICIGGDGLSEGYLNLPELTAEKFISSPFMQDSRLYKTGDMGRRLVDGSIEFAGRKDRQVKIRGFRIELAEIENNLLQYPLIKQCVVQDILRPDGERQLAAYLVGSPEIGVSAIREYLSSRLPAYMIPLYYVLLEQLPLTTSGKIDRNKLPPPENSMAMSTEYIEARNETEMQLAAIWQEVLAKEKIGMRDNFFESGGHSLKAIQILLRINKQFGIKLNLEGIFKEPTIEGIAMQIDFFVKQQENKLNKEGLMEIEL